MTYLDTFNPLVGQRYQELVLAQEVLGETDDRSSVADVQRFIFYAKFDVRFYALASAVQAEELWTVVRGNENILDFVMTLKCDLLSRFGPGEYGELVDLLARAHSLLEMGHPENCVVEQETLQRLPAKDWLKETLLSNEWLVVVLLINQSPLTAIFGEQEEQREQQTRRK